MEDGSALARELHKRVREIVRARCESRILTSQPGPQQGTALRDCGRHPRARGGEHGRLYPAR